MKPVYDPDKVETVMDTPSNGHTDNDLSEIFGSVTAPDFSDAISEEAINETLTKSLAPRGTYLSDPENFGPMAMNARVMPARNANEKDRRMITFSGRVKGMFRDRGEVTTFIRFNVSPDIRPAYKWSDGEITDELTGKDDSASNRWAEAVASYKKTFSEHPGTVQSVLDWLTDGSYKVQLNPFAGEIRVVKIKSVKDR